MFLAKFTQVSSDKFVADKNGQMPFIGTVLAGTARGTIINGTMFVREGLIPNKVYACDNFTDPNYPDNVQVQVVSEVSLLEYNSLRAQLGAPVVKVGVETPTEQAEQA